MASRIETLCAGVATHINGLVLSLEVIARLAWVPAYQRGDVDELTVDVTPLTIAGTLLNRSQSVEEISEIAVIVQRPVTSDAMTAGTLEYVQELADNLRGTKIGSARLADVDRAPAYDRDLLVGAGLLVASLNLTYREVI